MAVVMRSDSLVGHWRPLAFTLSGIESFEGL